MNAVLGVNAAVALVTAARSNSVDSDGRLACSRMFSEYFEEMSSEELVNLVVALVVLAANPMSEAELKALAVSNLEDSDLI
jgi:ectoine hydroxylase-related dioxygenase (phytanoyl-CoA dioxygenase family)